MPEGEHTPEAVEEQNTESASVQIPEPSGDGRKDPLDEIQDPEALRGEAKKFRSIAQRKSKPAEPAPSVVATPTNALTRDDLIRINTKSAKELVAADIQEKWADLADYVPPKYRNAEAPAEIAKGMSLAYEAYKADNPVKPGNPAADLQTTPAVKRVSAKPTETGERSTQPVLPKSTSMTDWYKKS